MLFLCSLVVGGHTWIQIQHLELLSKIVKLSDLQPKRIQLSQCQRKQDKHDICEQRAWGCVTVSPLLNVFQYPLG